MKNKYIDLFCGIGGFRIGMDKANFDCVYSADFDEHAVEMYGSNFGEVKHQDITKLDPKTLPDFNILCAGFPCQSFSISGKQQGFYDDTRGTLFFDICRILEEKKPEFFILENVKNLETHDGGKTLSIMLNALSNLDYIVQYKVLNARDFGVPQNRERIFIIGNRQGKVFNFDNLIKNKVTSMEKFLDENGDFEFLNENEYTILEEKLTKVQKSGLIFKGYRKKKIRTIGTRDNTEHLSRVHKQPNRIYDSKGIHPTIPSQESSGRFFIYVNGKVRKLTISECYRFMGFPEQFKKIGNRSKLYNRIGNSVCTNVVHAIGKEVMRMIKSNEEEMIDPTLVLEKYYLEATNSSENEISKKYNLSDVQLKWVKNIVEKESTQKGVYTVLITSLLKKDLSPNQDVRFHQVELPNGYSGRSFDTKYVTPFLKSKKFYGAMKESGWLTRSLEQFHEYDFNYPGKISSKVVKEAFLNILNDITENSNMSKSYLINIFKKSIDRKKENDVVLINPIERESNFTIDNIINILKKHFSTDYGVRGASILPVIAFYSIYQTLVKELKRFEDKELQELSSHYSSDRSSGNAGDILVTDSINDELYEVIEIKYGININLSIVEDAIKKISTTKIQRYYILSTIEINESEKNKIDRRLQEIRLKHGVQIIVNGLIPTLKYYLRLLSNTDEFLENYLCNLNLHPEIQHEQKIGWNTLIKKDIFEKKE